MGDATGLRGSTVAGSLYVSLHTADPDEGGDQTTSETAYTTYARVAVARTAGGWTVSGNTVSNAALVQFPQCGVTGATLTRYATGRLAGSITPFTDLSPQSLAAAVMAAAQAEPIHADIRRVNSYAVDGDGQTGTEWGPA